MKKIFSLFAAVLFAFAAIAGNVISIDTNTEDALRKALESAADGDEIVMAEGTYVESPENYLAFTGKSVTVRAAEGKEVIVQPKVPIRLKAGATAKFVNIKFDCGHLCDVNNYENLIVPADENIDGKTVILEGCEFFNWKQNAAILRSTTSRVLGTVTVKDCYIHDINKSFIFLEQTSEVNVSITNSTFANVSTESGYSAGVIDIRATAGSLLVDHCTFYDVLAMNTDYAAVGKVKTPSAVVSNSIFALSAPGASSVRAIRDAVNANNVLFYNYTTDGNWGTQGNVVKNDKCTNDKDPKFKEGTLFLADDSPAIGAGTDDSNLGDPRWWPAAAPEHTYTVAGDNDVLFVKAWDPTYEANDMSLVDGVYTWKKDNLTLAAGSIAFKVCEDHGWDKCWPAQNYALNIAQAGIYTVTITFKAESAEVAAVATKTGDAEVIPTVAMHGNFLGTWADTENFDLDEGNESASLSLTLAAGNYEFGMRIGGSGNWTANGAAFSRENSAAKVVDGQGNLTLNADAAGDYIFTWYYATETLNITFPEIQPAEAPAAAPADPTLPIYQVKAVYSKTYNADCNFGEWGSGTAYTQEDQGKKYVTANLGYFGLEFNALDCSEMEKLHLDVWIADNASIRIVPIHGGAEVGVTKELVGQKWNHIDIALSEFAGVTNWSNVYQIKIDNASNLTFWVNNVYFYTTVAPVVDLEDGYYLIGLKGWTVYDLKDAHKFAANPDNEGEYKLTIALENGDEFKVVEVKNNEIKTWFPGDADNYKVDITHSGEAKDIYFRPDYQGGEGWYEGCIYISAGKVNPYTTWFAVGDTWDAETQSTLTYDMDTEVALVKIAVDKNGQWRAQVKYQGPTSEKGKFYHVGLKLKANNALAGVTIKWEDNVETILKNQSVELAANTEFVFDEPRVQVNGENGNGVLVLDFGYAKAGDEIQIYDVIIEEVDAPALDLEDGYYLIGLNGWSIYDLKDADKFIANAEAEGEWLLANVTLVAGKEFKVVSVVNNNLDAWYGAKDGANYVVTDDVAGVKTIYFRPAYQEAWEGHIYVQLNEVEPASCDWDNINWLGSEGGLHDNQYKVCVGDPAPNVANIQAPGWADGHTGIYMSFPSAAFTSISLAEDNYSQQGAGLLLHLEAFSVKETEVTIVCEGVEYVFTVYNEKGEEGTGTSVDNNIVAPKAVKMIENGQLIIIRDGIRYNAQGQQF